MKKALSLALSLALLCTLAMPVAAAAEGADQRLTQVTIQVKKALEIPDTFTKFSGDLSEGESTPLWRLEWTGDDESINVTADESGKVLQYRRSANASPAYRPNDLKLPKLTTEQAKASATAFLTKVLTPGLETASFSSDQEIYIDRGADSVSLRGTVLLNKLPSPVTFRMGVRSADGVVVSYSRNDLFDQFLGDVPSASAKTAKGPAAQLLKDNLSLRLEYVQDAPGQPAVLRYLPNPSDSYYVDAQTGKLVNLTELYDSLSKGGRNASVEDSIFGSTAGAAPSASPEKGLSEVEQSGIAMLEGLQSKEELDKAARAIVALGLKDYTLSRFSYTTLEQENSQEPVLVNASLTYTKTDADGTWRRFVALDAKTGALNSVNSYAPYIENRKPAITEDAAQKNAETFLTAQQPALFAKTTLYEAPYTYRSNDTYAFQYAQKENGYFFPQHSFVMQIDPWDGSVSHYSYSFEEVSFAPAEGIISADQALTAWFDTFQTPLAYLSVPVKLDPSVPGAKPLMDQGYSYYSALKLGYAMTRERAFDGIDAMTGQAVASLYQADERTLSYSDLDGVWGRAQVEELTHYGIGWLGETLQPQKALTQIDLLALLFSAQGFYYDPAEQTADELYEQAYGYGFLTKAQRKDDQPISRMDLIRALLDRTGYTEVAALQGIFRCDFADASAIPASDLGYAALAQGLGIVKGDKNGNLSPNRTATRLETLLMLYQLMKR